MRCWSARARSSAHWRAESASCKAKMGWLGAGADTWLLFTVVGLRVLSRQPPQRVPQKIAEFSAHGRKPAWTSR